MARLHAFKALCEFLRGCTAENSGLYVCEDKELTEEQRAAAQLANAAVEDLAVRWGRSARDLGYAYGEDEDLSGQQTDEDYESEAGGDARGAQWGADLQAYMARFYW